jgi:hypothetical protein
VQHPACDDAPLARLRGNPERRKRAEHRHDRGHEQRGARAVDDALGRGVGTGAVEHEHRDGDPNRKLNTLRRDEIDQRFPDLLDAVLSE